MLLYEGKYQPFSPALKRTSFLRKEFYNNDNNKLHKLFLNIKEIKNKSRDINDYNIVMKLSFRNILQCQRVAICIQVQQRTKPRGIYYPLYNTEKDKFSLFLLKILNNEVRNDDTIR